MPKATKYPGLRVHVRKGKKGQVWTYYYLDRRKEGLPEMPLGTDRASAVAEWSRHKAGEATLRGLVAEAIDRWVDRELPKYTVPKTRRDYTRQAANLRGWCGRMRWADVTLPLLVGYCERRSAAVQANREMAVLSIVWGMARRWGMTALPFPGAGIKGWRNKEKARTTTLDMEVFRAVYAHADPVLRDAMDIASATGLRLTDVQELELGADDLLRSVASKTGKLKAFRISSSQVLPPIVARRRAVAANHERLLCTPTGRPVSEGMLSRRWGLARDAAVAEAKKAGNDSLAEAIKAAWLRDHRKLAANTVDSLQAASALLDHSSTALTRKHYRTAYDVSDCAR